MTAGSGWLTALMLSAFVAAYYGGVVRWVGEPLLRQTLGVLAAGTTLARRWSWAEADGVVRLVLAGLLQAAFIVVLVALTPVSVSDLLPHRWDARLIPLGILLGVGEAGLATQLALLASRCAQAWRPGDTPATAEGWLSVARGGWIRYYLRTAEAAPAWLLVAATVLYVAGEEIVFRGIVISCLDGLAAPVAVALSTALFVLVQCFYTPGWQTALFPMIGALVVGIVHGVLFALVPDLTPLIVAHAAMFLSTVL